MALKSKIQELEERIATLEDEKRQAQANYEKLQLESQREIKRYQKQCQKLKAEIDTMKERQEQAIDDAMSAKKSDFRMLKLKVHQLEEDLASKMRKLNRAHRKNDELMEEIENYKFTIKELKMQLKEYKKEKRTILKQVKRPASPYISPSRYTKRSPSVLKSRPSSAPTRPSSGFKRFDPTAYVNKNWF